MIKNFLKLKTVIYFKSYCISREGSSTGLQMRAKRTRKIHQSPEGVHRRLADEVVWMKSEVCLMTKCRKDCCGLLYFVGNGIRPTVKMITVLINRVIVESINALCFWKLAFDFMIDPDIESSDFVGLLLNILRGPLLSIILTKSPRSSSS